MALPKLLEWIPATIGVEFHFGGWISQSIGAQNASSTLQIYPWG
jgi:hypothetical protein